LSPAQAGRRPEPVRTITARGGTRSMKPASQDLAAAGS
jgi:hypothetical protein